MAGYMGKIKEKGCTNCGILEEGWTGQDGIMAQKMGWTTWRIAKVWATLPSGIILKKSWTTSKNSHEEILDFLGNASVEGLDYLKNASVDGRTT
jgi:hypothetical protein